MCTAQPETPFTKVAAIVSIPFKRESTCAHNIPGQVILALSDSQFQFPSNGKAHVHKIKLFLGSVETIAFQFPSNGKAHVHMEMSGTIES